MGRLVLLPPLCKWAILPCFYVESFLNDKAGRTVSEPVHHWQEIITLPGILLPILLIPHFILSAIRDNSPLSYLHRKVGSRKSTREVERAVRAVPGSLHSQGWLCWVPTCALLQPRGLTAEVLHGIRENAIVINLKTITHHQRQKQLPLSYFAFYAGTPSPTNSTINLSVHFK